VPAGSKAHVYVDVSGSIAGLKGALYGAVLDCRQWIHPTIHLFSERVIDASLAQLRQGICSTTVGTSIACVADHLRRHQVKRAVVLTDGYVGRPTGGDCETLVGHGQNGSHFRAQREPGGMAAAGVGGSGSQAGRRRHGR
jgi:hypothetical protein